MLGFSIQTLPSLNEIGAMVLGNTSRATDGCEVELDGTCPHGCPSWLIELGILSLNIG